MAPFRLKLFIIAGSRLPEPAEKPLPAWFTPLLPLSLSMWPQWCFHFTPSACPQVLEHAPTHTQTQRYAYADACTHTHSHKHTQMYIHAYTDTRTYRHAHTQIQTHTRLGYNSCRMLNILPEKYVLSILQPMDVARLDKMTPV